MKVKREHNSKADLGTVNQGSQTFSVQSIGIAPADRDRIAFPQS